MRLSRTDLLALARKYTTLGELRRSQYEVTAVSVRHQLRGLAHEFPGALRELDVLPLDEIDRRAAALIAAVDSGDLETWMLWIHAYHSTMRAALVIKQRLAGRRSVETGESWDPSELARGESGYFGDVEFIRAVASPPDGRINRVVFRRLELTFGEAQAVITRTLFPERKRG